MCMFSLGAWAQTEPADNEIWVKVTEEPDNWEGIISNVNSYWDYQAPSKNEAGYWVFNFYYQITDIPENAFKDCSILTAICIPSTVMWINSDAFSGCANLSSITFAEGSQLGNIGERAFENCISLTEISIPATVYSIGADAFKNCGLTEISIPASMTSIGDGVFSGCNKLASVTFAVGNQLTGIGSSLFNSCSALTEITIPADVTSIGDDAFAGCSNLASVTMPSNNPPSLGTDVWSGIKSGATINIPSGALSAYVDAGWDTWFTIGESTVPTSRQIWYTTSSGNAFSGWNNWISAPTSNVKPEGKDYYIATFPYDLAEIPGHGFYFCKDLTSIVIPSSVTSIGESAFSDCSSLSSVKIPESVISIGDGAFWRCTSLPSVTIPASVKNIGFEAFYLCESLGVVTMLSATPPTLDGGQDSEVWVAIKRDASLIVPAGAESAYKSPVDWSKWFTIGGSEEVIVSEPADNEIWYTTSSGQALSGNPMGCTTNVYNDGKGILTFEDDVTSITAAAFAGSSVLTSITIPASVESIGNAAFASCTNLTSISFAEGSQLASFGSSVFSGCGLTSIEIPAQVTSIPNSLFSGLSTLQSVTFASDSQLKTIENQAFRDCSSLATIELPATVTSIGEQAFSGCSTFTTFEIPTSVASIGASAFQGCTGLISMEIPAKVTTLLSGTFSNCTNLTSVTFAEGSLLESIGSTFANSGLVSIEIPAKVSTIASGTFHDCKKLESVTFAEGSQLTTFASEAFNICINLTTIDIPESVTTINNSAFSGCSKLADITVHWTDAGSIINPGTAFSGTTQDAVLHVPFGTKSLYENADVWKDFFSKGGIIEMPFELNVSELGWASLYLPVDAVIPASAKVYYAASIQDDDVTLTEIKNVIPANTGVIVKANPGTFKFPSAEGEVPALEGTNLFKGLTAATPYATVAENEGGKTLYVLAGKDTDGVTLLFQPFNTTSTLAAYKVYLPLAGSQQNIKFRIADDDATSINSFRSTNADNGKAVNLLGVPVDDNYKGIILKGGKKFLKK